ncbi:MAG: hypothetical protein JW837_12445 [Sedimentisphaerales bacterium]|nr:hypothetical protein [Sedimentisphaerales bacterium]
MLTRNKKIVVFFLLILLGAVLITYGVVFHSTNVLPQNDDGSPAIAKSEPALIREASVGGVKRDESGKIKQTYTGQSPKACAT